METKYLMYLLQQFRKKKIEIALKTAEWTG